MSGRFQAIISKLLLRPLQALMSILLGSSRYTQFRPLRRIVAGHDEEGRGTIKSDVSLQPEPASGPGCTGLFGGALWTTDSSPATDNNLDLDGAQRKIDGQGLVMRSGTNLRFTDLAPGASSPMHRTSSIDYNVLVFGKVVLVTDDGSETLVENPGDVIIQKGNMHAWRNPSTKEWCRWVSVLVDAEPARINGQNLADEWLA